MFNNHRFDIEKKEISFVVCGKIEATTKLTLLSIRKFFPCSYILLSTWKNSSYSHLNGLYDFIILNDVNSVPNKDIKCSVDPNNHKINSYNLQMFCIHNALKKVKTKYAVRFRTDFYLKNDNFYKIYIKLRNKLTLYFEDYKLFSNKVLISNVFTRDPEKCKGSYCFDTSDLFAFGETVDLLKRWNGKMLSYDTLAYFSRFDVDRLYNPHASNSQYSVEEYGLISIIKDSNLNIKLPKTYIDNSELSFVLDTYRIFLSNFYILPLSRLGLNSKFSIYEKIDKSLLRYKKFLRLYRKFFKQDTIFIRLEILKDKLNSEFIHALKMKKN